MPTYPIDIVPPIICGWAFFLVTGMFWFRAYTGYRGGGAYVALLASVIAGSFASYHRAEEAWKFINADNEIADQYFAIAAAGIFIVFAVPFGMRLWGRWVGNLGLTEEREPGVPGVRAWFSRSNIIVGVTLVITAFLARARHPCPSSGAVVGRPALLAASTR